MKLLGVNYMAKRINFKVQATLLIACNDEPEIKPSDANETRISFFMKSKFVMEKDINNPDNLPGYLYLKKDDEVKHLIANDSIINEFILLIWESYYNFVPYPSDIINYNNIGDDTSNSLKCLLLEIFKITGNPDDFIATNKIIEKVTSKGITCHIRKIREVLINLGAIDGRQGRQGTRGLCNITFTNT